MKNQTLHVILDEIDDYLANTVNLHDEKHRVWRSFINMASQKRNGSESIHEQLEKAIQYFTGEENNKYQELLNKLKTEFRKNNFDRDLLLTDLKHRQSCYRHQLQLTNALQKKFSYHGSRTIENKSEDNIWQQTSVSSLRKYSSAYQAYQQWRDKNLISLPPTCLLVPYTPTSDTGLLNCVTQFFNKTIYSEALIMTPAQLTEWVEGIACESCYLSKDQLDEKKPRFTEVNQYDDHTDNLVLSSPIEPDLETVDFVESKESIVEEKYPIKTKEILPTDNQLTELPKAIREIENYFQENKAYTPTIQRQRYVWLAILKCTPTNPDWKTLPDSFSKYIKREQQISVTFSKLLRNFKVLLLNNQIDLSPTSTTKNYLLVKTDLAEMFNEIDAYLASHANDTNLQKRWQDWSYLKLFILQQLTYSHSQSAALYYIINELNRSIDKFSNKRLSISTERYVYALQQLRNAFPEGMLNINKTLNYLQLQHNSTSSNLSAFHKMDEYIARRAKETTKKNSSRFGLQDFIERSEDWLSILLLIQKQLKNPSADDIAELFKKIDESCQRFHKSSIFGRQNYADNLTELKSTIIDNLASPEFSNYVNQQITFYQENSQICGLKVFDCIDKCLNTSDNIDTTLALLDNWNNLLTILNTKNTETITLEIQPLITNFSNTPGFQDYCKQLKNLILALQNGHIQFNEPFMRFIKNKLECLITQKTVIDAISKPDYLENKPKDNAYFPILQNYFDYYKTYQNERTQDGFANNPYEAPQAYAAIFEPRSGSGILQVFGNRAKNLYQRFIDDKVAKTIAKDDTEIMGVKTLPISDEKDKDIKEIKTKSPKAVSFLTSTIAKSSNVSMGEFHDKLQNHKKALIKSKDDKTKPFSLCNFFTTIDSSRAEEAKLVIEMIDLFLLCRFEENHTENCYNFARNLITVDENITATSSKNLKKIIEDIITSCYSFLKDKEGYADSLIAFCKGSDLRDLIAGLKKSSATSFNH